MGKLATERSARTRYLNHLFQSPSERARLIQLAQAAKPGHAKHPGALTAAQKTWLVDTHLYKHEWAELHADTKRQFMSHDAGCCAELAPVVAEQVPCIPSEVSSARLPIMALSAGSGRSRARHFDRVTHNIRNTVCDQQPICFCGGGRHPWYSI
jgi:hypothetical protein